MSLTPTDLATVHLVPLTPFDSSGEFAEKIHRTHIARLCEAGVTTFLPAAATSGFYQLTASEISRIVATTVEAAGSDRLVFAPLGLNDKEAIEIGHNARKSGASGIMFMPATAPYLSNAGLKEYYLRVMEAIGLPALIYKKAVLPSSELLLELADHPLLIGIKYASPDIEAFHQVVQDDGGRLAWLCGLAERYAVAFMSQGALGYTSGAGNLAPRLTLEMHRALTAGDFARGLELQRALLPIERFRGREGDSYNISLLQYGMQCLEEPLDFGQPRLPMRHLSSQEEIEAQKMLREILELDATC